MEITIKDKSDWQINHQVTLTADDIHKIVFVLTLFKASTPEGQQNLIDIANKLPTFNILP